MNCFLSSGLIRRSAFDAWEDWRTGTSTNTAVTSTHSCSPDGFSQPDGMMSETHLQDALSGNHMSDLLKTGLSVCSASALTHHHHQWLTQ